MIAVGCRGGRGHPRFAAPRDDHPHDALRDLLRRLRGVLFIRIAHGFAPAGFQQFENPGRERFRGGAALFEQDRRPGFLECLGIEKLVVVRGGGVRDQDGQQRRYGSSSSAIDEAPARLAATSAAPSARCMSEKTRGDSGGNSSGYACRGFHTRGFARAGYETVGVAPVAVAPGWAVIRSPPDYPSRWRPGCRPSPATPAGQAPGPILRGIAPGFPA